jgi:hypothetical protein
VRATSMSVDGDKTKHGVMKGGIKQIVGLGDSFLRVDIRSLLESFCHAWSAGGL